MAAFAFMAAATWLGVGVLNGLLCLLAALVALQAATLRQRRHDSRTRRRPRPGGRARPDEAPRPAAVYDADLVW